MSVRRAAHLFGGLLAVVMALGLAVPADAQEKKIKIGVIFDLTGPLAGGGSELQYTPRPASRVTRSRRSTRMRRASRMSQSTRRFAFSSRKRSTC